MVAPLSRDISLGGGSSALPNRERLLLEKEKLELELELDDDDDKIDYADATKGQVAGEIGRSFVRGGREAAEFYGDIYDIGRASVDGLIPGAEDRSFVEAINPFGPPDKGDLSRQENLWNPVSDYTDERINKGGSAILDAAKTATEYVLPTATSGFAGAGKKLLKDIANTSAGAAGGEFLGGLVGETSGEIGEVVGAVTGVRGPVQLAKSLAKKLLSKETPLSDIEKALQTVMAQADDPAEAQRAFLKALDDGDEGTLADLMGDAGVYNVEALADKGSKTSREVSVAAHNRNQQMIDRVEAVTKQADPNEAATLAKAKEAEIQQHIANQERRRGLEATIKAQEEAAAAVVTQTDAAQVVNSAEGVVDAAEDAALIPVPVSEQSKKLADTYDIKSKQLRDKDVQPFWDAFDNHPAISTPNMEDFLDSTLKGLKNIDEINVRSEFAKDIKAINQMGDTTLPNEIHAVISSIKTKLSALDSSKPYQKQMAIINKNLEKFLENSPAGAAYKQAREAEAKFQQRVNPGGIGKARRQAEEGELLTSNLALQLEAGAVTAKQIMQSGSPAIVKTFKDTIRALANRANTSDASLNTFLTKHDELLEAFPDVKTDLHNLRQAQEVLVDTTKESDAIIKAGDKAIETSQTALTQAKIAAANKSKASQGFVKARVASDFADKPKATINKIMNSENAPAEMSGLIKAVGPKGKKSLVTLVGQEFIAAANRTKEGIIDAKIQKQFADLKPALTELMTPDEIAVIEQVLGMSESAAKRLGASAKRHEDLTTKQRFMASVIAAMSLNFMPGNNLILAGATRSGVKDLMLKDPDPAVLATLDDMVKNPQKFEAAIRAYEPKTVVAFKDMIKEFAKQASLAPAGRATPAIMVQSGDDETLRRE